MKPANDELNERGLTPFEEAKRQLSDCCANGYIDEKSYEIIWEMIKQGEKDGAGRP